MFFRICCLYLFFTSIGHAQSIFMTPETPLEFGNKKRITEILRHENYGEIEPFFYVSNRPTIQQALADEIKNRTLVSPVNHMIYCPPSRDFFTNKSRNTGTIYVSAENLPKNGTETNGWFNEAYRYRTISDSLKKPANVAIISAKRQNFLRVRCPNTHNNIIVSMAPAPAPVKMVRPQLSIEQVKNLRYADNPEVNWDINDYSLPSSLKNKYVKTEVFTRGKFDKVAINPPQEYIEPARKAGAKYGVFIKFLLAIAEVASDYNLNKISNQGKRLGITQLPSSIIVHYDQDPRKVFNAGKAFSLTARYLKDLSKQYDNDVQKVLSAYYYGIVPSDIKEEVPDLPAIENFVIAVSRRLDKNQPVFFN